jgi:hypothetical protein
MAAQLSSRLLAVRWILIDAEARHDRGQVLFEEELEMIRRIIDVHRTDPDWSLAVLLERLDRSREAERRDTPSLGMSCPSLVDLSKTRGGLRIATHPYLASGE